MPTFRKKSLVVEAVLYRGTEDTQKLRDFAGHWVSFQGASPMVTAALGGEWISPGDWIVREAAGQYHVCKPEAFESRYEPVE